MMRRAAVLAVLALAGCGKSAAPADPGELAVERIDLARGRMALIVASGTDEPATLAQVSVADGFVPYDGPVRTVAAHASTRLTIPYPWIAGYGYDVKVITGDGDALEYELEP
jgi:hypothetical protein